MRFCAIHFHIIVGRHIAFYYKSEHPKGIFLTQVLPNSKNQIVHALYVSHCRVPPNVSSADSAKTSFYCRTVKFVVWVSAIKVEGNLAEISARELLPFVCISLDKCLVITVAVVLFISLQPRAFRPKLTSKVIGNSLVNDFLKIFALLLVEYMAGLTQNFKQ